MAKRSGGDLDPTSRRAVVEYLAALDDAAFGGDTPTKPKISKATPDDHVEKNGSDGPHIHIRPL